MKAMGKVTLTLGLMIIVSLFLTSCNGVVTPELQLDLDEDINTVTPEIASGNLENTVIEDTENTVIEDTENTVIEDTEESGTVYPQQWATGDGTAENPWANDCIQKAYDFVPAGGTIFLRSGYYELSDVVTLIKKVNIVGDGIDRTIVITANAIGFSIKSDYCSIKNFTIDGDNQTDGQKYLAPISISNRSYLLLENIEVKNAGYYGIDIFQVNHSLFQNIYAHDNWRHGMHPGTNAANRNQYNIYETIYCWNNGVSGFDDRGGVDSSNNIYDGLHCWDNGAYGISITDQSGGTLINSFVHDNNKYGLNIRRDYNFTIENCFAHSNENGVGIYLRSCDNINLSSVIAKNNDSATGTSDCGIYIYDTPSTKLSLCQSYDDRDSPLQDYGIRISGTTKYVEITNCKLTPNAVGAIKNGAGAVITITETKLARF